jgi:protein O-GlcNAc transferase
MLEPDTVKPQSSELASKAIATGWRLRSRSQWVEAARICHKILSGNPGFGEAWHLLGLLALDQGDHSQAVDHLKQAIAVEPDQALHYNNLGVVLNEAGFYTRAADYLQQALEISPDLHDARCNLGLSLFHQSQLDRAATCFEKIVAILPNHKAALANLGMTRLAQQRYAEAVSSYEKAIAGDPTQPGWHGNLGAAFMRLGRFERAARCFRQALGYDPHKVDYHANLGIALRATGDLSGSIEALEAALSREPLHSEALANLVVGLEYTCQWDKLSLHYPRLDRDTRKSIDSNNAPAEDPMLNIRRSADIALNRSVAQAWSRNIQKRALRVSPSFSHERRKHGNRPIVLGYLSYDFRNHPVAHQLYPLFGLHDRSRFHVIAFSMGPDDGSRFRREIIAGCDEFIDISSHGLEQAARLIYDRGVDILIDLMGHTHHNRMEIPALRPAPIQVSYLGFLATTGADYVDYLIADKIVVPKEHTPFFAEKLLRLPHCYQMNHACLMNDAAETHRQAWGLPSTGFVYCSFNNVYKIDRFLFDTWMRILRRSPGSVLWLNGGHPLAVENMRMRAETAGIEPDRLIFAEKVPLETHLKRLPLADLALDTLRYNGGATTANALSVGLPVLTMMGRHWVSRMSASHLTAAGMPDLVFDTPDSYEKAAVELSCHSNRLDAIRQRLADNLKTQPLFDTRGFIRHLEAGLESIWQRYENGLQPDHIDVPSDRPNDVAAAVEPGDAFSSSLSTVSPPDCMTRTSRIARQARKAPIIYYVCPDIQLSSAGMRRLYRHVALLNGAGFAAFVLHGKNGFRLPDMPQVPVTYLDHIGSERHEIFVIPEGVPRIMHQLRNHPGRRFVIALNWHYIFSTLPDGVDWRQMNIERVLVVSPVIGKLVSWSMGLPVHVLRSSIDHQRYYYEADAKKPQIAFIKRKAHHVEKLRRLLGSRNKEFVKHFKWVGLEGLTEDRYAAEIRKSSVFLNLSAAEGYPTSCLEAMAAGAIVAGYDAVGGREILSGHGDEQNCILAPNGDYVSLAYALEPVLLDLIHGQSRSSAAIRSNARKAVSDITLDNERQSLLSFWTGIGANNLEIELP